MLFAVAVDALLISRLPNVLYCPDYLALVSSSFQSSDSNHSLHLLVMAPKQIKLSQLRRGGMTDYLILRVARRWNTIYPTTKKFPSIDFVFIDVEGKAIHGYMEPSLDSEFDGLLDEGLVYKIENFEVKGEKPTHNAVSSNHTIILNWSTVVTECTEDISRFPRFYFEFATMDQIMGRESSDRLMTDVIGMLIGLTKPSKIKVKNQDEEVEKQTIQLRLLSGAEIKILIWSRFLCHVDLDSLVLQQPKPIFIVVGIAVKKNDETLGLTTTTGTKILVNLEIPETTQIREKFQSDKSPVMVLAEERSMLTRDVLYKDTQESTVIELLNFNPDDIGNAKFRVCVIVKGIDQSAIWYYAACGICGQAMTDTLEVFHCTQHQVQTPQFTPKIPLLIKDHTARMKVMIFGDQARDMTGVKVGNISLLKKKSPFIKLPDEALKIIGNEYNMVLGLSAQSQRKSDLSFKVFHYTLLQGTKPSDPQGKGKTIQEPAIEDAVGDLGLRTPQKNHMTVALDAPEPGQPGTPLTPEKRNSTTALEMTPVKQKESSTSTRSMTKKVKQSGVTKKLDL